MIPRSRGPGQNPQADPSPGRTVSRRAFKILLLMLVIASPFQLLAQVYSQKTKQAQIPDSQRKLTAIKTTGSKRYSQDQIAAASGLHLGSIVSDDDFKKAARRLGDTGAFGDIAYSFSYSTAGTKLEFQLVDADKFVPVRFEDFVWFSDEELQRTLRERVPLYAGELPISGRLPEQVSDVLQAMLVEKNIPGHVAYQRIHRDEPKVEDGSVVAIDYTVSDVLIRIHRVDFSGAGQDELPLLESAARKLSDLEYSRDRFGSAVERDLLPIYRARGYLKASFGTPQPRVVKPETDGDVSRDITLVDVTLVVMPGRQYKLERLEWSGNHEVPTDMLQSMVPAKTGQPANTVELGDNLSSVKTLYGSQGYITASIKPEVQFDDAAGIVAIRLEVNEGHVYHMGDLEFRGIDNSLTAKLRNAWKIRPGDVFDSTYLKQYVPEARRLLPVSLDWDIVPHVTANLRDKTVDVDFQLTAKAPK